VRALFVLFVASCLGGCLSATPLVPVTPTNAQQISSCSSDANAHNWAVIGGTALAGVAGAEGTIASQVTNASTAKALDWSILIEGVVAAAAASLAGVEASNYAQSQCPSLEGPLPLKPEHKSAAYVLDDPTVTR
jgi:hypothetical protein